MKDEKLICCKDCKFFKGTEHRVSLGFMNGFDYHKSSGIKIPSVVLQWYSYENNPVKGRIRYRKRINGQGQFNKNNDCEFFEKRKGFLDKLSNVISKIRKYMF